MKQESIAEPASEEEEEAFMSSENHFASQASFAEALAPQSSRTALRPRQARTRISRWRGDTAEAKASLITRLQAGDQSALEETFNLYSAKLYNIAHRILGDIADTEEVIQDVFWTVYRKAKSFQGNSQFSTWLYRLTVNAALGKIRRSKKRKEVEYDEFLPKFQNDGHHLDRPVVDWSDTLDEKYAEHEIHQLLGKALDQLKPVDKSVIVLSDLEGLSDKEIAAAVGLTVSAVKTRLHRARLFLRGKLAVQLGYSAA
jgi:RNA polymerase sigma-70 factor, ECF subfamily